MGYLICFFMFLNKNLKNFCSGANRVNVIYCDNGRGLSLDARIVTDNLKRLGFQVLHNDRLQSASKVQEFLWRVRRFYLIKFTSSYIYHLNIHVETINQYSIQRARKNFFMPNLEWLPQESYKLISEMDKFICKTRHAQKFFENEGLSEKAIYTSFSTYCVEDTGYKQLPNTFVHIAGKSNAKGTLSLISIWSTHPEWPLLKVFVQSTNIGGLIKTSSLNVLQTDNIQITDGYLPLAELRRVQNEAEVHICLSEVEGFGHYICEPLSLGSIVLTTNAEPMNELVVEGRGILVNTNHNEVNGYARNFYFDHRDFENNLQRLLSMSIEEKSAIKKSARDWYVSNDAFFKKSISEVLLNEF